MANFDPHHVPDIHGDARKSEAEAPAAAALTPPLLDPALQRKPVFTAVRWGAVLAGVVVGLSVQLALTLFGVASGLSTISVGEGESVGVLPLLWAGIGMLVSAFVGGYVSARMSGLKRTADGVLHGAVSWAVTTILFAVLATSIGGALVGGVFANMNQLAEVHEQAAEGEGPLADFMRNQFGGLAPATLAQLRGHLQRGEREQAVQLLTFAGAMDAARAEEIVDQALIVSGSPEKAAPAAPATRAPTPQALKGAGMAAWIVFGAVALGLVLGMGGGRLGVAGARRVNWAVDGR